VDMYLCIFHAYSSYICHIYLSHNGTKSEANFSGLATYQRKGNSVTSGKGIGKCCYTGGPKRKMQLHPGKENGESQLHLGNKKGNSVTSGKGIGKCSYIRAREREMQLHPGRENGKASNIRRKEKGNAVKIRGTKREIRGEENYFA